MSKLKSDKISFDNDDVVVGIEPLALLSNSALKEEINEEELILNRAKSSARELISSAENKARDIVQSAVDEARELKEESTKNARLKAQEILKKAQDEAQEILKKAQEQNSLLIQNSNEQIEAQRIEEAKRGYEEGHEDGLNRVQEELEEKISAFDNFCSIQYEIRNKILKKAGKDIFDVIANISKKILLKEPEPKTLEKIILAAVELLEEKENIKIILSKKYASLLFELQKHALGDDIELKFEDFKQYNNFEVLYNPNLQDDTIIVENLSERFDASLGAQLDVIIRDILKNSKNGFLDTKDYLEDEPKGAE